MIWNMKTRQWSGLRRISSIRDSRRGEPDGLMSRPLTTALELSIQRTFIWNWSIFPR